MQAGAVVSAIFGNFNKQMSRVAMYRALFDHPDWRGGGTGGFRWIASAENTPDELAGSIRRDLIGDVTSIAHLDPRIRAHRAYLVPFFGELGKGHQVIVMPTPRGNMIAAFTTEDAVDAFLATGSAANRAKVKFVGTPGDELFGNASQTAQGVIVNIAGPKPYGFDLDACADVVR